MSTLGIVLIVAPIVVLIAFIVVKVRNRKPVEVVSPPVTVSREKDAPVYVEKRTTRYDYTPSALREDYKRVTKPASTSSYTPDTTATNAAFIASTYDSGSSSSYSSSCDSSSSSSSSDSGSSSSGGGCD